MNRHLVRAILLIYPRRVRRTHGREIIVLVDDLAVRDGRPLARLLLRLAFDGLIQRLVSTAVAWTAVVVLAATTLGDLALSDFAAASGHPGIPAPARAASRQVTAAPPQRGHDADPGNALPPPQGDGTIRPARHRTAVADIDGQADLPALMYHAGIRDHSATPPA